MTTNTGTCPRCGQVEYLAAADGLETMKPHMLPGDGALIECSGTGQEPAASKPFGEPHPLVEITEGARHTSTPWRVAEPYDLLSIDNGTPGEPWTVALYLNRETGRYALVTIDEAESIATEHDTLSEATELYGEAISGYGDFGA